MKIVRISAYQVDLPRERTYRLSGGRTSSSFDTTVVRMESDTGLVGLGEVCPFGSAYLPAYAAGVRTGIAEVAPRATGVFSPRWGPSLTPTSSASTPWRPSAAPAR